MVKMIAKRTASYQGRALQAGDTFDVSEKLARQYRMIGKAVNAEEAQPEESAPAVYETRVMTAAEPSSAAKPGKKAAK